ncbi:MAG: 2Fe-2S iron-sulfur cluster-binding protein [Pseudomonadales bacterium]
MTVGGRLGSLAGMIVLTFVTAAGVHYPVDVRVGDSVMDAALDNAVPGIRAQCGGGCTCCTCHCYVPAAWRASFPSPGADEVELLAYAWSPTADSRLACQLRLTPAHDGLVIRLPSEQA